MLSENTPKWDEQKLLQELNALAYFSDKTLIEISIITSGLSQPSFCVRSAEPQRYFVKRLSLFVSTTNDVSRNANEVVNHEIQRKQAQRQQNASILAAKYGITAPVLYYDNDWLVTAFIVGESLASAQLDKKLSAEDKIDITLALLARCHQIPWQTIDNTLTVMPTFAPQKIIDDLLAALQLSEKQHHAAHTLSRALLAPLTSTRAVNSRVFCHGDANYSNILYAKTKQSQNIAGSSVPNQQFILIDFECAYLAPPEYDVGMFIAINELSVDKCLVEQAQLSKEITQRYNKTIATSPRNFADLSLSMVTCYHDLSLFINMLWYRLMFQQKELEIYNIKADKQLTVLVQRLQVDTYLIDEMR